MLNGFATVWFCVVLLHDAGKNSKNTSRTDRFVWRMETPWEFGSIFSDKQGSLQEMTHSTIYIFRSVSLDPMSRCVLLVTSLLILSSFTNAQAVASGLRSHLRARKQLHRLI